MVAISILGAAAVAELSAIGWALAAKFHAAPSDLASSAAAPPLPGATPAPAEEHPPVFNDPFAVAAAGPAATGTAAASPAFEPAGDQAPVTSLPKPTPIPQTAPTAESRINDVVEQARRLREQGDMSTALTRLGEGLNLAPNSALLISELATTYEKMGQSQKALEQWRRIYDMGESAGIYYAAADAKLKNNELTTRPASPAPEAESSTMQPGSVLGLVNPQVVEQSDAGTQKKLTLKIPLKARPNSRIDVSNVVIQVFFYDQLGDGNIVQTNANVSSHWSTLPADWLEDDIEILEVDYTQPKPDPGKTAEDRHYYGYVVRIYYKKELQDVRAEPVALLKKYPPPLTLQGSEPQ